MEMAENVGRIILASLATITFTVVLATFARRLLGVAMGLGRIIIVGIVELGAEVAFESRSIWQDPNAAPTATKNRYITGDLESGRLSINMRLLAHPRDRKLLVPLVHEGILTFIAGVWPALWPQSCWRTAASAFILRVVFDLFRRRKGD